MFLVGSCFSCGSPRHSQFNKSWVYPKINMQLTMFVSCPNYLIQLVPIQMSNSHSVWDSPGLSCSLQRVSLATWHRSIFSTIFSPYSFGHCLQLMAMVNDMNADWQVKSKQTTVWAPAWPPQTSAATQTLLRLSQFVCQFDFCNPNINEACNMQMIILTYHNYL